MAIHMGIVCQKCGKLHLIPAPNKVHRISFDKQRAEYKLTCFCQEITYFQKRMLKPFSALQYALDLGYADLGEYAEQKESTRPR